MNIMMLGLLFAVPIVDSLSVNNTPHKKNYANQTFVCGVTSAGFGMAAVIFNAQSDNYYVRYKMETTIGRATNYWNRVVFFADMRNMSVVGSVAFLLPTVYFGIKHLCSRNELCRTNALDLRYCDNKMYLFVRKTL